MRLALLSAARAGDEGVAVRLAPAAAIRGTVVGSGGEGQAGQVQVAFKHADGTPTLSFTEAREAGRFELEGLSAGTCVLIARTASGLASAPRTVDLGPGEARTVELEVVPGGRVHLLLPPGAYATVRVEGELADFGLQGETTTRALRPGPVAIEVYDGGPAPRVREVAVAAGEVLELDLR